MGRFPFRVAFSNLLFASPFPSLPPWPPFAKALSPLSLPFLVLLNALSPLSSPRLAASPHCFIVCLHLCVLLSTFAHYLCSCFAFQDLNAHPHCVGDLVTLVLVGADEVVEVVIFVLLVQVLVLVLVILSSKKSLSRQV